MRELFHAKRGVSFRYATLWTKACVPAERGGEKRTENNNWFYTNIHFVDNGLFATAFVFAQDALELIVVMKGKSIYLHLFILESEILTDSFQLFSLWTKLLTLKLDSALLMFIMQRKMILESVDEILVWPFKETLFCVTFLLY